MDPITLMLLTLMALCSNVSASEDVEQQTPNLPKRSSNEDVQAFRRFVQEAPRTIAARRSALLSAQRREIGEDILHQIALWTAAPDHLLEAGESISSPISGLIWKVAFPHIRLGERRYLVGKLSPLPQLKALGQELKRRIGEGTLQIEVHGLGQSTPLLPANEPVIKLTILKDGNQEDLHSFAQNVFAEIKRIGFHDLESKHVRVSRISHTEYLIIADQLDVEFKFHLAPPALRINYAPVKAILSMQLLQDHIGGCMRQIRDKQVFLG